jgi:sulfur-oxidizing protein SoxZ
MTMPSPLTRIKVPASAARGSIVPIKVLVSHVMETGDRRDAAGERVPRHIVNRFTCTFNGQPVFSCDLGTGVSANPFFEFDLRLAESGRLNFNWFDDDGSVYQDGADIEAV